MGTTKKDAQAQIHDNSWESVKTGDIREGDLMQDFGIVESVYGGPHTVTLLFDRKSWTGPADASVNVKRRKA